MAEVFENDQKAKWPKVETNVWR